jgi:uncharacterized membrane protein
MSQEHRYIVRRLYIIYTLLIISIFLPSLSLAQELVEDKIEVIKAVVLEVKDKDKELIPTFNIENKIQEVKAKITEGENKDREITFNNDFTPLSIGEVFYLNHTIDKDGSEYFAMLEPYRLDVIYLFLGIFILLTILIGGIQGIRGLISLAISLILIVYALVPFILSGYSPILVSILVSSVIIILGSYITHGFNKTTTSAVFGMILTVIVTGIMAYFAIDMGKFSGYETEEAVFLNLNHKGNIDLVGILIGGIMIGLLGVLYDVAINQAIFVKELHNIAPHVKKEKIFKRAFYMGREHIGALVDTLAIAYVGASLPLLLLFSNTNNIELTLNREIFAVEIIRILIGSIGLILAVPITTIIATFMLVKEKENLSEEDKKLEEEKLKHYKHSH